MNEGIPLVAGPGVQVGSDEGEVMSPSDGKKIATINEWMGMLTSTRCPRHEMERRF